MLRTHWLFLYRICALAAVFVSALLFLHYQNPVNSGFCGGDGGCEVVRQSTAAYGLGPFIPVLGILAYGGLLGLSLAPASSAAYRWLRLLSVSGGVAALLLVVLQAAVIQAFCWLCLIVDGLAVAVAFASLQVYPLRHAQRPVLENWAWVSLLLAAAGLPFLWSTLKADPAVPAEIRAFYKSGKINVVEFADYQCPYCARLHPILKSVLAEYGDRVHFVRKHVPLPQHPFAEQAARGAICAEHQAREGEMSDALFGDTLSEHSVKKHAEQLGLDMQAFEACLKSDATEARLKADRLLLEKVGFEGLPTTYIGEETFVGARPAAVIREMVDRAASTDERAAIPTPLFVALSALLLVGIAFAGRTRGAGPEQNAPAKT